MNCPRARRLYLFASLLSFSLFGCDRETATDAPVAGVQAVAPETPEQQFELIMDQFRRGVEETPLGFEVPDASGGKSMMTGRNRVTHEIIQPAKEGDPLKAKITVRSETKYSIQRSSPNVEAAADSDSTAATNEATSSDFQVFDPAVSAAPAEEPAAEPAGEKSGQSVVVARTDDAEERTYELVYEGNRWKLVTKLDPNTEELIKYVFDRALASQG